MTDKAYRFSASAIDELNKHRGAQRLSTRRFALLMAGLVALLLLLYVQIVWNAGSHPPIASRLPVSSENVYHSGQFGVRPGNLSSDFLNPNWRLTEHAQGAQE
jgi:hypothetical protein